MCKPLASAAPEPEGESETWSESSYDESVVAAGSYALQPRRSVQSVESRDRAHGGGFRLMEFSGVSFVNRGIYVDGSTALVNGLLLLALLFISLQRITGFDVYFRETLRRWQESRKVEQEGAREESNKKPLD